MSDYKIEKKSDGCFSVVYIGKNWIFLNAQSGVILDTGLSMSAPPNSLGFVTGALSGLHSILTVITEDKYTTLDQLIINLTNNTMIINKDTPVFNITFVKPAI